MELPDDKILTLISYPFAYIQYFFGKNESNKIILPNIKSQKVLFLLPHWMGTTIMYKSLINKLKNNYTIVFYRLPNKVLDGNPNNTFKYFQKAKKDIISIINHLEKKGHKEFSILGFSISTVLALMVSNNDNRIKKIIISMAGSDLAECVWYSNSFMVKDVKNRLLKNGINLSILKRKWSSISPINNINNLKNKDILILLSKNDDVIKYKYGLKLLKALEKKKINYKNETDHVFGHYLSGCKQLLFSNNIVKFLET